MRTSARNSNELVQITDKYSPAVRLDVDDASSQVSISTSLRFKVNTLEHFRFPSKLILSWCCAGRKAIPGMLEYDIDQKIDTLIWLHYTSLLTSTTIFALSIVDLGTLSVSNPLLMSMRVDF